MNAILSGRSGRALIIEADSLKSFDLNNPSKIVPRQKADLPYLFGEAADLRILENTSLESVERELRDERNFTWGLELTLISLDAELPRDIRKEAIVALEELFATKKTVQRVENVLYAAVLPKTADLKGALELCDTVLTKKFLRRLEKYQPKIFVASQVWESIAIERFGSASDLDELKAIAVREGLFRALVMEQRTALSSAIQKLPNHKEILNEWQRWALPFMKLEVRPKQSASSTLDKTTIKGRIKALKEARNRIAAGKPHKKHKDKRVRKDLQKATHDS